MKVRDLLHDNEAWKELYRITEDLLDAGGKCRDGVLYMLGLRLGRILTTLAVTEVEIGEQMKTEGGEMRK